VPAGKAAIQGNGHIAGTNNREFRRAVRQKTATPAGKTR